MVAINNKVLSFKSEKSLYTYSSYVHLSSLSDMSDLKLWSFVASSENFKWLFPTANTIDMLAKLNVDLKSYSEDLPEDVKRKLMDPEFNVVKYFKSLLSLRDLLENLIALKFKCYLHGMQFSFTEEFPDISYKEKVEFLELLKKVLKLEFVLKHKLEK